MDKVKKKQIKRIIALVCIAVIVVVLAVMPLIAGSEAEDDGPVASILSGTAELGSVSTAIKGGGTLTEEDAVEITIPSGVMLTQFLVSNGDAVSAGDALATVDRVSVMSAISQVQETLEYLDKVVSQTGKIDASIISIAEAAMIEDENLCEVRNSLHTMSSTIETTAGMAEQSAAASNELDGQTNVLKENISRYRI